MPQRHLEKKKIKQICFWPSPFVHAVVVALVAAIVRRLTLITILSVSKQNWLQPPSSHIKVSSDTIGLTSDDVTKPSNAWQRGKLVLNKDSAPYKSMLGEKSLTGRSSLFLSGEIRTVLTTPSRLSASHFKRSRGSDKCGAVFRSIDNLPACFCMGRYLCLEPILPVATPVAGL